MALTPVSCPDRRRNVPNRVESMPCPLSTKTQPDSPGSSPAKATSCLYRSSLCVVGVPVGVAQHPAGERPGVLAFLVQHLAVDDGGEDAFGRLLDPPRTPREVAHDGLLAAFHGGRVEDHDVGGHAGAKQPAVVNAEGRGRVEGQPAHRLLQTHDLLLAYPFAEQLGEIPIAAVELHMCAAIAEPDHCI